MVPIQAKIRSQRPSDDFKNRSPSSMASRLRLGGLRNASWASLGPGGRRKGAENPLGRASNTLLDAKVVLERLWNGYEVVFGSVFKGIFEKNDKYKDK